MTRRAVHATSLGLVACIIALSACSAQPIPTPVAPVTQVRPTPAVELRPPPGFPRWQEVLDEARGTMVSWYMWGGSAAINDFVDTFYGDALSTEFGIRLNRVPVADTVDAVNLLLSEAEAGIQEGGSVDMIWINGENFYTLRQADLLYGPWALGIPNSALVDWDNPAVAYDFGVPVDGYESPWSSAQLHFIYDSARMDLD